MPINNKKNNSTVNHTTWVRRQVAIKDLILDRDNPRFPDEFVAAQEEDLIKELIEKEALYDLAKKISDGFPDLEILILLEEKGKYVVLEGNRRAGAYKSLLNPELVYEKNRKKFEILAEKIQFDGTKVVDAYVVKERDHALPLIEAKHTSDWVRKWSPAQIRQFTRRFKEKRPDTIEKDHEKKIASAHLYEMSKKLDLPADVAIIVNDPKKFALTTLERIVLSNVGMEFLGFNINNKGEINITSKSQDFKQLLRTIVIDVARKNVTSRKKARNVEEIKNEYLPSIKRDLPVETDQPNPTSTAPLQSASKDEPQGSQKDLPPKNLEPNEKDLPMPPLPRFRDQNLIWSDIQAADIVRFFCNRFPLVVATLRERDHNRAPLIMNDEYDIQYLLKALLKIYFDELRWENPTAIHAGKSARIDITQNNLAIETKMLRKGMTIQSLGDELLVDIPRYRKQGYKKLFFFIYDPEQKIRKHASTLIKDIQAESNRQFSIEVIIPY